MTKFVHITLSILDVKGNAKWKGSCLLLRKTSNVEAGVYGSGCGVRKLNLKESINVANVVNLEL